MTVVTTAGDGVVDRDEVAALAAEVSGPVLQPGDADFADECAGFNLLGEHRPSVVVGATTVADVVAAVRFATRNSLPIGVLCTGHTLFPSASDGVLITTRRLSTVHVDAERRTARVGAGALAQRVADATAAVGLAALSGSSPDVGFVGYCLGGGMSPIAGRSLGWATDFIRSIEIVTADGGVRTVTPTSDPDLFWAVRGGKSNFGVVTALEVDLFEITKFYGGGLFFDGEHASTALHAYRQWITEAPDELSSSVAVMRMPDLEFVPELFRGRLVVHVRVVYLGQEEDGAKLLAPMRAAAPVLLDTVAMMPYQAFASVYQDVTSPVPYEDRSMLLTELSAAAVETVLEFVGPGATRGIAAIELRHFGGALARTPRLAGPLNFEDAWISVFGAAVGGPDDRISVLASLDELQDRLAPWRSRTKFLNFLSRDDGSALAYLPEDYQRMRTVKRTYDPSNYFRLNNHNIRPAE
jgi:FAD/FMN-containing dehydrogenase